MNNDKKIHVFKNAEYRFRLNCLLLMAIFCTVTIIATNNLTLFCITICILMFTAYLLAKNYFKNIIYYLTITVDNLNQKLIFQTVDGQAEIFEYKNIKKIEFQRELCYNMSLSSSIRNNCIVTNIRIYDKSDFVSNIELPSDEFSYKFLKKLPSYIKVERMPNITPTLVKFYLFIVFLFVLIAIISQLKLN